jgi:hypothetical protein
VPVWQWQHDFNDLAGRVLETQNPPGRGDSVL